MIPIAPTVFSVPMAYAVMGGFVVAALLTLVFLPALYVTWFQIHRRRHRRVQRVFGLGTRDSLRFSNDEERMDRG